MVIFLLIVGVISSGIMTNNSGFNGLCRAANGVIMAGTRNSMEVKSCENDPQMEDVPGFLINGGFHSHGGTHKWMVYKGNPTKIRMIWGYPYFRKPPNVFKCIFELKICRSSTLLD